MALTKIKSGIASNTFVTDRLGYTPANKAGDTFTGTLTVAAPIAHNNLYSATYMSGNHGNITRTFKIAKINSFYWGEGGTTIEVWRRYFTGFGYAMYRIDGHGATYYGPSFSSTLVTGSGGYTAITGSSLNIVNSSAGTDGWGYYDILITESPYYASVVKITSGLQILPAGSTIVPNKIVMYPDYSY
jgi:hypothetical protein